MCLKTPPVRRNPRRFSPQPTQLESDTAGREQQQCEVDHAPKQRPVLPDDPNEEYPVGDGTRQKSLSEAIRGGAAGVIEGAQATLGDTYDPTEEF